jgi:hypothetical protein
MQYVLFDSALKLGLGYDAPDVTAARIFALKFVTRLQPQKFYTNYSINIMFIAPIKQVCLSLKLEHFSVTCVSGSWNLLKMV